MTSFLTLEFYYYLGSISLRQPRNPVPFLPENNPSFPTMWKIACDRSINYKLAMSDSKQVSQPVRSLERETVYKKNIYYHPAFTYLSPVFSFNLYLSIVHNTRGALCLIDSNEWPNISNGFYLKMNEVIGQPNGTASREIIYREECP